MTLLSKWKGWRTRRTVDAVCSGYSDTKHWNFFSQVFADPTILDICILGVYRGRDLAYIASILESYGRRNYNLIGVDKFEDTYGADWPSSLRNLSWEQAGFGKPPDMDVAQENLRTLNLDKNVKLVRSTAQDYLQSCTSRFHFIYIDISHDYETTLETIDLALSKLTPRGFLGGDDFSDQGNWGVASAVRDSFSKYEVFSEWIWTARSEHYTRAHISV